MNIICPTITAENPHTYRDQVERLEQFANHVHLDLMDGVFAPSKSIALEQLWLPKRLTCDVHVMYEHPEDAVEELLKFSVRTIIVPAESKANFKLLARALHDRSIQFGIALLPDTPTGNVFPHMDYLDHVLIFSGNLGYQGGSVADLTLLDRVKELRKKKPALEIGWDGGVDDTNCASIAQAGVNVINTGGFVHFAPDPAKAYHTLVNIVRAA